jgi:hypothetical protein
LAGSSEGKPNIRVSLALHDCLRNRIDAGLIEMLLSTISQPSHLAKNKCTLRICSDVL